MNEPILLPERRRLCGPLTAKIIARSCAAYGALFLLGLIIFQLENSPGWKAFGMGLMMPGGGFLSYAVSSCSSGIAHLLLTVLAMMLFGGSLMLWFSTGNVLAPPIVWLSTALAALFMDHGAVHVSVGQILSVFALLIAFAVGGIQFRFRRGVVARQEANRYLARAGRIEAANILLAENPLPDEYSLHDLKLMRFLLDRALQPIPSFDGFEWRDQFQTAAVRYQLNFSGYALSMAKATRLQALGGYLDEAQRRLIEKQTDHRIWRYWKWENLWGNLVRGRDPVARDNIMYSGFCALQIAMFQAASGHRDFDRPGSFTLRRPDGETFTYDFPALIETLDGEYRRSKFHLIPCEPNWIYPLCNAICAAAVKAYEVRTGNGLWSVNEVLFRRQLEDEFIDLYGRFVPCRSTYTGLALPIIGGAMPQAMPCLFLNATLPDIALRQWLLLRRFLIGQAGSFRALRLGRFWPIDTGNYRFSRAAAFAAIALSAVEMGDHEVAALCLSALDDTCPVMEDHEAWYRPKASVWSHAVEFLARSNRRDGFRDLIERPRGVTRGLMISHISYPDVLVAKALSQDDMLTAVLYPGDTRGLQAVTFSGLVPGGTYFCDGAEEPDITADSQGIAVVRVVLEGRKGIRIHRKV